MFSAALLPGPAPATAGAERFRKHLRLIFNAEAASYIENWLAWVIQRPGVPTRVMLVIIGPWGCGKTWLLGHLMGNIMGPADHSRTTEPEKDLFSKCGGDASLVFMDGSIDLNRRDIGMKLKLFISGGPLSYRTMYGPEIIKTKCSNYCMATNDGGIIIPMQAIGAGRVFIAEATIAEGPEHKRHFQELYALVDDPSFVRSVFDFLMSMDLTAVNLYPPPPGQQFSSERGEVESGSAGVLRAQSGRKRLFGGERSVGR